MKEIALYHRASAGGVKVWILRLEGEQLTTKWGIYGGRMQETSDLMKPKGKPLTRAYKPAAQVADEEFDRKVKKKMEEGYVDDLAKVRDSVSADSVRVPLRSPDVLPTALVRSSSGLDFNYMPKEFAPSKPVSSIETADAKRLEAAGKLTIQRKRDGLRTFIVKGSERTTLWSRRMEQLTDLFPEIAKAVHESNVPAGTILDTEFVVMEADGVDNLQAAGSIMRCDSLTKANMRKGALNWNFLAFDLLYLDGNPVYKMPHRDRLEALRTIVDAIEHPRVGVVETLNYPLDQCIKMVHVSDWEGLVLWDSSQPTVVQMNGKPKRCNCYKLKPVVEDDFVATHYELGSGRFQNAVGALFISQYDKDGKLVSCGKVGTGFDTEQREEALKWTYPAVVQLKFAERTEDGSLWHPVFLRKRDDKAPEECVIQS